jgi:hypothetical protein
VVAADVVDVQILCAQMVYIGGQSTILIDIHCRYPRACVHQHSLQTPATKPAVFSQKGPSEVYYLCVELATMVEWEEEDEEAGISIKNLLDGKEYTVPKKKIYSKHPHLTANNHFSGENVMDYIGKNGLDITNTCCYDCFPNGLKDYFHDEKVPSHDKRTRVVWFKQPIFAVKRVEKDNDKNTYTKTFVSFQFTGVTNISGVNNLLSLTLYVQPKYRGVKKNKFAWATEHNEGREIYPGHYHSVDSMDYIINTTGNRLASWKYWHSLYLHAMSMGIIVCYNMYLECCEGELDAQWKVKENDRMTFLQSVLVEAIRANAYI